MDSNRREAVYKTATPLRGRNCRSWWAKVNCRQNHLRDEDGTVSIGMGVGSENFFHHPGHPSWWQRPLLAWVPYRPLAQMLEPVPSALEGIARYRDSSADFARKQAGKRDVQSGLIGLRHGSHEPFIGLGRFLIA